MLRRVANFWGSICGGSHEPNTPAITPTRITPMAGQGTPSSLPLRREAGVRNRLNEKLKETRINTMPSYRKITLGPGDNINTLARADIVAMASALGVSPDSKDVGQDIYDAFETARSIWCDQLLNVTGNPVDAQADYKALGPKALFKLLPDMKTEGPEREKDLQELHDAMEAARLKVFVNDKVQPKSIALFFGGTAATSWRDHLGNVKTAAGTYGDFYKDTKYLAKVFAKLLKDNADVRLDLLSGHSRGGGAALFFESALQSRIELTKKPATLVFDPQLNNDSQAAFAVEGGDREYYYQAPRAVAVTLNSRSKKSYNLVRLMKGLGGYTRPGIVELQIPLNEEEAGSGPLRGLRYHSDAKLYSDAVKRFLGKREKLVQSREFPELRKADLSEDDDDSLLLDNAPQPCPAQQQSIEELYQIASRWLELNPESPPESTKSNDT